MPKIAALSVVILLLLAGCAGQRAFDEGQALIDAGKVPEGLAKIEEAYKLDPSSKAYRETYFKQRDLAVQRYLAIAEQARSLKLYDEAEAAYRQVLIIDPANPRALASIDSARTDRRHRALLLEAQESFKKGDEQASYARVKAVLSENAGNKDAQQMMRRLEERSIRAANAAPQLGAPMRKPITLEFRDTPLRAVFELISKNTGLNFIFDRDVRPDLRTTLFVRDKNIEDVIRFILVTNQLDRKVLDENTMLVYPNTPAKIRDYQDLTTKSFYLANADAKQTAAMVKTMVKTKDIYVDEKLNLLMMRDTPEAVRMAERLIATQDLAEPEVMLEVEVLEVSTGLLSQIGIRWPTQASASLVGAAGTPGTVTLPEWLNRNSNLVRLTVTDPLLIANLQEQTNKTNLLANPRIRVKNKEKAKVHIGDKVPVITTTTTATGFAAESVSYLDVGLKLDVEPTVFLDDEVGIKIGLEVSNIVQQIRSASGTLTYQIGTRNAATVLRLKDGETQVLAGLISDEDRRTADNVPGLGDLPVIGRLFSNHNNTVNKTEIVLLITPRVIRNLARPELRFEEFASGTESAIGAQPLVLQSVTAKADVTLSAPYVPASSGAAPAASGPQQATKILLLAPPQLTLGQEFTIQLNVEAAAGLRNGVFDLAYDPSRLQFVRAAPGKLLEASPDLGFRANSPQGLGRLSLSFAGAAGTQGSGELVLLTFQAIGAPGAPAIRLEAMALTDAGGKVLSAQLPPPLTLSLKAAGP